MTADSLSLQPPFFAVRVQPGREHGVAELLRRSGAIDVSESPGRVRWCGSAQQLTRSNRIGVLLSVACQLEWPAPADGDHMGPDDFSAQVLRAVEDMEAKKAQPSGSTSEDKAWTRALERLPIEMQRDWIPSFRTTIHRFGALAKRINIADLAGRIACVVSARTGWEPRLVDFDVEVVVELSSGGLLAGLLVPASALAVRASCSHEAPLALKKAQPELLLPDWFITSRSEQVVRFDTQKFPFRDLLADLLEVNVGDLHKLHMITVTDQRPLHPKLAKAYKDAGHVLPEGARRFDGRTRERLAQSEEYKLFQETYRRFAQEVVAPLCGSQHVVFQNPATLRIVLPGGPATINLHRDQDYPKHQPAEINFWLPVTNVFGTNALWLESSPGLGDFRPRALEFGELLRFNGYECRHYTVRNESEVSRVSFDLRAVPSVLAVQKEVFGDYPADEV